MSDFDSFMARRKQAALDYVQGKPEAVDALAAREGPATFFGPDGKVTKGADGVRESYAKGSKAFGPHGESELEVLQMAADGDVGYWTGIQHAKVEMGGKATPMDLRVTELFRKEGDDWKLVHRHADLLKA